MQKLNLQFTQDDIAQASTFNTIEDKLEEVMQELRDLGYAKSKNLFTGDFSQFDSTGGTGTVYGYFKLPTTGEKYSLTITAKNNFTPTGSTYLGFSKNGGQATGGVTWVMSEAIGSMTAGQTRTLSNYYNNQYLSFVSMFSNNSNTLKTFTDNFYIQLEKGDSTPYVPYKDISYTKKTWIATDYLLYTYLNNIEEGLENIAKVYFKPYGWQDTKTWTPRMSFSYRDINRWINNLNLIIERLNTESNTLFPSDTLYPSETLLPH